MQYAADQGLTYVHPFADPLVIAGPGTVALEILDEAPDLDALLVAVGGGGLIAGIAIAAKALKPAIRVIGVEPTGAPTLYASLAAGRLVELEHLDTAAVTLAPRRSESLNLAIITETIECIVLVEDDEMAEAARWLWSETGVAAELGGAAAVAAVLAGRYCPATGERVCAVFAAPEKMHLLPQNRLFDCSVESTIIHQSSKRAEEWRQKQRRKPTGTPNANRAAQSTHRGKESTGAAQNASDLLEHDHREVEEWLDEYDELKRDDRRKADLAKKICTALKVHAQLEDEIFYPAAREASQDDDLLDEAIVEHATVKNLIAEIEDMETGEELYDAKIRVLGGMVKRHIREEEEELFPELQSSKMDLSAVGEELAQRKQELMEKMQA